MKGKRILFVDDEPNLRLTFPQILNMHGFEVRTTATVAQALSEITIHPFDILISDLNIGEPGDGFTVVSAMRRTQPSCINFILTGFPAFESALAAIQRQVDGYLVKPANIAELVSLIEQRLQERQPRHPAALVRLSNLLRERVDEICNHTLSKMKSDPVLSTIAMSDQERADYLPRLVLEIANQLDSAEPDQLTTSTMESSFKHGLQRFAAGYNISMLVTDSAILDGAVFDTVREHLLMLDTSNLVLDLKHFNHALQGQLERSIQAYWDQTASTAGRSGTP
jgi:ActR/RegA family two-component response regulator